MKHRITRLEQALRTWENRCAILGASHDISVHSKIKPLVPKAGPIAHWREYRDYLLRLPPNPVVECDLARFFAADKEELRRTGLNDDEFCDALERHARFGRGLLYLPWNMAIWSASSRRVFNLPADLFTLFKATSFGDLTWADVVFPFRGFAITLGKPLQSEGLTFDCILASLSHRPGENEPAALILHLLSPTLEEDLILDTVDAEALPRLVAREKWGAAATRYLAWVNCYDKIGRRSGQSIFTSWLSYGRLKGHSVEDGFETLVPANFKGGDDTYFALWTKALRIVLNLCVYLTSLPVPPRGARYADPPPPGPRPRERTIVDGADVCAVTSEHFLSADERRELIEGVARGGHVMPIHWRRGHGRKAPGRGHDPNAPKKVKVRPTLVNRARLDPGELPGGAETKFR